MSTTIDHKILSMDFDNKSFESNVQTSMRTLDNLKSSLNMNGAADGLNSVSDAASKINVGPLGEAVEGVKLKFSALEIMAVTALANITNSIISTGTEMVKSLTIDPIMAGFSEYELKMDSVQTIMSSTGQPLSVVNTYLEDLNTYADRTIYSFADMTQNIGKFTNSGVKLDDAVLAIQGISNEAAVSGANANEASRAMYNFAQALSSGFVKLIDWKSIENANMATVEFKQLLIDTASEMGTLEKKADGMYEVLTTNNKGLSYDDTISNTKNFNDSLQYQWMTNDVLIETLKLYADETTEIGKKSFAAAQDVKTFSQMMDTLKEAAGSGWAKTSELILGDFDAAKVLFTNINKVVGGMLDGMSDSRNNTLEAGLSDSFLSLKEYGIEDIAEFKMVVSDTAKKFGVDVDAIIKKNGSFEKSLSEGWVTADILGKSIETITGKYENLSDEELINQNINAKLVGSLNLLNYNLDEGSVNLQDMADGLLTLSGREKLIGALANAFKFLGSLLSPIKSAFEKVFPEFTGEKLYELIDKFKKFTETLTASNETTSDIYRTFTGFFSVIKMIGKVVGGVIKIITKVASVILPPLTKGILSLTGDVGENVNRFRMFEDLLGTFDTVFKTLSKGIDVAVEAIVNFSSKIKASLDDLDIKMPDVMGALTGLYDKSKEVFQSISDSFPNILDSVSLKVTELKTTYETVSTIMSTGATNVKTAVSDFLGSFSDMEKLDLTPLKSIGDKIAERFAPITNTVKNAVAGIKDASLAMTEKSASKSEDSSTEEDDAEKAAEPLKKTINIIIESVNKFIAKVGELFSKLEFNNIMDIINSGVLITVAVTVKKYLSSISGFFDSGSDLLKSGSGFVDKLVGIFDGVRNCLQAYQEKIKADVISTIAKAVVLLAGALVVLAFIPSDKLNNAIMAMAAVFMELLMVMKSLDMMSTGGLSITSLTGAMIAISTAMLIASFALKNFSGMSWDDLGKGIAGMTAIAGAITILLLSLKTSGPGLSVNAIGLLSLGFALSIMTKALANMSGLSWDDISKGMVGLGGALVILMIAMKGFENPTKIATVGLSMIVLSKAMQSMAKAMKTVGELSWAEIGKGFVTLAAVLLTVAVSMEIMNKKNPIQIAAGIYIVTIALGNIANVMSKLSELSWSDIAKGLVVIAGALASITIALNFIPDNAALKGAGLMVVVVALSALVKPLQEFGAMSVGEIAKSLIVLSVSLAAIAIALVAMDGSLGASTSLLVASAAITVLAGALEKMGNMSVDELIISLVALAGSLALIGAAALILKPLMPTIVLLATSVATIGIGIAAIGLGSILLAAGLAALGGSITLVAGGLVALLTAVLGTIPLMVEIIGQVIIGVCDVIIESSPKILEAFLTLIETALKGLLFTIPTVLSVIFEFINATLDELMINLPTICDKLLTLLVSLLDQLTNNVPTIVTSIISFIGAIIGAIFSELSKYDTSLLGDFVLGMYPVVLLVKLISELKKDAVDALIGAGAVAAVMIILGGVFALLRLMKIDECIPMMESLSLVMLAMAASMLILSRIPVSAAATAVASLGVFVGGLAILLTAVGGLAQIPGFNWILDEGAKVFEKMGKALGGLIGGVGAGIMTTLTGALPQVGEDLSLFMSKADPFFKGVKGIDSKAMEGVKAMAETILLLTGASLLQGIASFFTGGESSIAKFGEELVAFAPSFKKYSDTIKGLDGDTVIASSNAAKSLAEFAAAVPNSGGWMGTVFGENGLAKFGEELVAFAPHLMSYARTTKGLDASVVENSVNAAKAVAEFAGNVPKQGGWFGSITGSNSIATFGKELSDFGPSLASYANSVKGLDTNIVDNSVKAAKAVAGFADNVPKSGGIAGLFTGDNSIDKFGKKLAEFGIEFVKYYDSISKIDAIKLDAVTNSIGGIIKMVNKVKDIDSKAFSDFADDLNDAGKEGFDEFMKPFSTDKDISKTVSTFISAFTKEFKDSKTTITTDVSTVTTAALTTITDKKTSFKDAAVDLMAEMVFGITNTTGSITGAIGTILGGIKTKVEDYETTLFALGTSIVKEICSGMEDAVLYIQSSMTTVLSNAKVTANGMYTDFYNVGDYLMDGMEAGIKSMSVTVADAAKSVAKSAVTSMRNTLEIKSPSRIAYSIGEFFTNGFTNALLDNSKSSGEAAEEVASNAKKGLLGVLSGLQNSLDSELDTTPVIRPVLDLSNITEGSRQIGSLVTSTKALSISADIARSTQQYHTPSDVNTPATTPTIQYTQNNYSPKSLSRVEIYRQTNNQLASMRGLVKT